MGKICLKCGNELNDNASVKFCSNCGNEILTNAKFCGNCGTQIQQ